MDDFNHDYCDYATQEKEDIPLTNLDDFDSKSLFHGYDSMK